MVWRTIKRTISQFIDDGALGLSAAIAFYTCLSLAPLLTLLLSLAGWLGRDAAIEKEILYQTEYLIGPVAAELVQTMMQKAREPEQQSATVIGLALLAFGATTVFAELRSSLNTIWGVRTVPSKSWLGLMRTRLVSFGLIVALGFLLLVSLVLSAAANYFTTFIRGDAESKILFPTLLWIITVVLFTLALAAIFKVLPDVKIGWRDVALGALLTSIMLATGKEAIGLYLGNSSVSSMYGAAGSLVVLLVWVYYAACILLLGAELTQAMAQLRGRPIAPSNWAVSVDDSRRAA